MSKNRVISTEKSMKFFNGTVVKIPTIWVIAGISALLFGIVPRVMTGLSFAVFGAFVLIEFFWERHVLSNAIFAISPFSHVYPTNEITALPTAALTLVALSFAILGMIAFIKRDVCSN